MTNNKPFDLSLLDHDGARKRRRKRYLFYCMGPIAILLLAGIYVMMPWLISSQTVKAYTAKKYQSSQTAQKIAKLSIIEKSNYYYNVGTMQSANKDYEIAIASFEKALGYLGDSEDELHCKIIINLVLTYERWADQLVQQQKQPVAIERYVKALSYIKDQPDCFENRQDKERIEAKLKAVRDAEVSQDNQDSDDKTDKSPSESDKEEIQKREQEAQKQRSEEKRSNEDSDTDFSTDYKQW